MAYKFWTEKEVSQLRETWYLYPKGVTREDLEEKFGRNFESIRTKASSLGFKSCAKWTKYEVDYLEKYLTRKPIAEIAEDLKRSERAVNVMACRCGFSIRNPKKHWSKKEDWILHELVKAGKTSKQIAKAMNRTKHSIDCRKRKLGIANQRRIRHEENE